MFLSLYLGLLHAMEPDHVAVVTGVSLDGDRRRAWRVGLAFGLSHMLAVALLSLLAILLGREAFGDTFYRWMDRGAWIVVALLGLWNLAAAFGLRRTEVHSHAHRHGALTHAHPHPQGHGHRFHHGAAWLGAFFGLGGIRGFATLLRHGGVQGNLGFALGLLCFGIGITAMFILLSAASGWLASAMGSQARFRRTLYAASGFGNLAVGLLLLARG